jgi:hypothetical protein
LSLRYGNGDLHWFEKLPREDQTLLLAVLKIDEQDAASAAKRRQKR